MEKFEAKTALRRLALWLKWSGDRDEFEIHAPEGLHIAAVNRKIIVIEVTRTMSVHFILSQHPEDDPNAEWQNFLLASCCLACIPASSSYCLSWPSIAILLVVLKHGCVSTLERFEAKADGRCPFLNQKRGLGAGKPGLVYTAQRSSNGHTECHVIVCGDTNLHL